MPGEFTLINQFFTHTPFGEWKSQGVGDDCALIDIGASRIAVTTDMMGIGTHFFEGTDPRKIGHKALATNLSDLAAAGSSPRAFFLSIALPAADEEWLSAFSGAMMELAHRYDCALLGGDTVRTVRVCGKHAPATISITAMGELGKGLGLTRAGALPGDDIWVSGTLGGPFAVVQKRYGLWKCSESAAFHEAEIELDTPEPRVKLGEALLEIANACADISDGFIQDLGHILERSSVAARVDWRAVPIHPVLRELDRSQAIEAALSGGDDYELVWTAPKNAREKIRRISERLQLPLSCVGEIIQREPGRDWVTVVDETGVPMKLKSGGFDHFS